MRSFHHMGKLLLLLGVLWLPAPPLSAAESTPPLVRAAIQPQDGIWVGQRVVFQLDVLAKDGWAQVPRLPDLQASGAIVVRMETQGVRLSETIDGEAYTGQRYELLLFPQRGGEITVPETPVEIEISRWGSNAKTQRVTGTAPRLAFSARMPPGAEPLRGLVSTNRLSADQKWDPDADTLSVGAAVERRITLDADNVSAMAFPALTFEGTGAVDVYPKPPEVADRYDRGQLTARRTEAVTYVFKRAGRIELPAVSVTWWDLGKETLQETVLPARIFEVAPAASAAGAKHATADGAGEAPGPQTWVYGLAALLLLLTVSLVAFQRPLRRHWQTWRERRQNSEKAFYRRFVTAGRRGKPTDTLNALMRWLDRIQDDGQAARLDRFLEVFSDAAGKKAAEALVQAAQDDTGGPWQGRPLLASMTRARRRWRARGRRDPNRQRLPQLNP